jgi:hypothetical protein
MARASSKPPARKVPTPAEASAAAATGRRHNDDRIGWFAAMSTYFGYAVLILFGHLRDALGKLTGRSRYFHSRARPAKVRRRVGGRQFAPPPPLRPPRSPPRAARTPPPPPCPCSTAPHAPLPLSRAPQGYAPLMQDWESFFTRRLFHRVQDCWNRPIAGPPYANELPVVLRETPDGGCSFT